MSNNILTSDPNLSTSPDQSLHLQFDSILNTPSQWQSSPIDATRQCLKLLHSMIKSNSSTISTLSRTKCSKTELNSALNIKANVADIMRTFSEVANSMEQRPTIDDVNLLLADKVNKEEVTSLISSRLSIDDLNRVLMSGDVKVNLKCYIDELKRNFVTVKDFNEAMTTKANKDIVINALHKKANKSDVDMTLSKIIEENVTPINNRVNDIDTDIDRMIDNIKKQFGSLTSSISNDMNDVNKKIEEVKVSNEKIKNEMSSVIKGYDDKHNMILAEIEKRVDSKIGNIKGSIDNEINTISNDINTMSKALSKSASKNDIDVINDKINSMSSSMRNVSNNRCDMNEIKMNVDTMLTEYEKKIDDKLNDIHQYTQEYIKNFDNDITLLLDKKANLSEMNQLLSAKADSSLINSLLDNKVTKTQFESLSLTVEKMSQDFLNKIDYDKFDAFVSSTNTTLSSIQKDLMMKANISESMSLLKEKADIDEVNKALTIVHDDLDMKTNVNDFNLAMDNQNAINSALSRVNIEATFLWKSGDVTHGVFVPWEEMSYNTAPNIFLWEKDTINLIVSESGVYQFDIAFFVKTKPVITLMINGENALSVVNSNGFVVRHERNIDVNSSETNIEDVLTGLSAKEFFMLPAKARIAISYSGDDNVKGIMRIKKIN